MLLGTKVEWHDLRIDPEDLPENGEPILITIETLDGSRVVWLDAFLQDDPSGDGFSFVTETIDPDSKIVEKTVVWYPVIAWAYPPEPYFV